MRRYALLAGLILVAAVSVVLLMRSRSPEPIHHKTKAEAGALRTEAGRVVAATKEASATEATKDASATAAAKNPKRSRGSNSVRSSESVKGAAESGNRQAEPVEESHEGSRDKKAYDDPEAAEEYYLQRRVPPGQTRLPQERYAAARQRMDRMPGYSTALDQTVTMSSAAAGRGDAIAQGSTLGSWTPLGPGNIGGRTRALLVHPTTPSIMYAGGVAGGVWKSTDAGASWVPLNDLMANLSVSSLAFAPTNPDIIYAGTGEGFYNSDAQRGNGIFKSTDAGVNWTHLTSTDTPEIYRVNDVAVSKSDANRVYAATRYGIFRSTDGGTTWTKILNPDSDLGGTNGSVNNGGCSDIAMRMDGGVSTDYMFVACGGMNLRNPAARIYRSTDAGATSPVFTTSFTEANMGRTSLAIAPSVPTTVYAMSASSEASPAQYRNGLWAVYRSTDSGDNWTARVRNTDANRLNTLLLSNPSSATRQECSGGTNTLSNQGWYDNVLAVDPLDPDRVWAGGIDLWRSDNGGASWGVASYWWNQPPSAHADQHAIVFHPQYNGTSNKIMYVGNDGGIQRTDDARAAVATTATPGNGICSSSGAAVSWTSLNNNYGVTQFYHGLPFPDGMSYFGGTQDNGTIKGTDAGGNIWDELLGGDGSYVAVDPANTNIQYAATQNFGFRKSTTGAINSFTTKKTGIPTDDTTFLFITPFIMDPSNASRLWTGSTKIYRTVDGADNWVQASTDLPFVVGSSTTRQRVSALAIPVGDGNKVLIGTNGGQILRSDAALSASSTTDWTASSFLRPSGGFVSWVAFDPTDANIVYATVSSFLVDAGDQHVFKSTNGGATWTGIDGTGNTAIPDIPVHSIVVDPTNNQRLYVGTDLGVFVSLDGGANWARENTGFANVVTESLAITTRQGVPNLYAFTHGRGAWRVPLAAAPTPAAAFSGNSVAFGNSLMGHGSFSTSVLVSNPGSIALTISSVVLSGSTDFTRIHNCPTSLGAGGSCTVTVTFNPSSPGLKTGTLTITTNAPGSPHAIALSGTGATDLVFSISRTQRPGRNGGGASSAFELVITPASGFEGTMTLGCSGKEADIGCTIQPRSVQVTGAPVTATLTVNVAGRSLRLRRSSGSIRRTIRVRATMGEVTRTAEFPIEIQR